MQTFKTVKYFILFLVYISMLSCGKDDNEEAILSNDLIGEWRRSDFNNEFEFKLIFNSPNTGYQIQTEGDIAGGTAISSLVTFNWSTADTVLTLRYDGETLTTNYSIDTEGRLFLNDIYQMYFIKID